MATLEELERLVEVTSPNLRLIGHHGVPFHIGSNAVVRCTITDASHWRRGIVFSNSAYADWNYVPFYLATMKVYSSDPKNNAGRIWTFSVDVMMSAPYFQLWHFNKGAGYNNLHARSMFIDMWNEHYATLHDTGEPVPVEKKREEVDIETIWETMKAQLR